jgi:hypothetical protein
MLLKIQAVLTVGTAAQAEMAAIIIAAIIVGKLLTANGARARLKKV